MIHPSPRSRAASSAGLPAGTPEGKGAELRSEGWVTIAGLEEAADARAEARRLECGHVLDGGTVREIETGKKSKD